MNFIIKVLLIMSIAKVSIAHEDASQDYNNTSNDEAVSQSFDFNDAITQEIDNYNNNIASEILGDEHDSNNNISTENITIKPTSKKFDLQYAFITILNKITAKHENFVLEINNAYKYKNLSLEVTSCHKSENNDFEDRALIKIIEVDTKTDQPKELFSGWLFSKSSITSLAHPIYDITLTKCSASEK